MRAKIGALTDQFSEMKNRYSFFSPLVMAVVLMMLPAQVLAQGEDTASPAPLFSRAEIASRPILSSIVDSYIARRWSQVAEEMDDVVVAHELPKATAAIGQAIRAEAHLNSGNAGRALEAIREAIRLEPENPKIRDLEWRVVMGVGDFERAVAIYLNAAATSPEALPASVRDVVSQLTAAATKAGADREWGDAGNAADNAVKLATHPLGANEFSPKEIASLFLLQGQAAELGGQVSKAFAAYGKAIDQNPSNLEAFMGRARVAAHKQMSTILLSQRREVEDSMSRALQLASGSPNKQIKAHKLRAELRRKLGDQQGALADLNKVVALDNKDRDAHISRAHIAINMNDCPVAIPYLSEIVTQGWADWRIFAARGYCQRQSNDNEAALLDYSKAVASGPNEIDALVGRVHTLKALKRYKEAVQDVDKLIELAPNDGKFWSERGLLRFELGDYLGTIADLNEAISKGPETSIMFKARGAAKANSGDYKGAEVDFERAALLDPRDSEIGSWLQQVRQVRSQRN